jgi:hypothetical protein
MRRVEALSVGSRRPAQIVNDFTGVTDPHADARISRSGPETGQGLVIGENP